MIVIYRPKCGRLNAGSGTAAIAAMALGRKFVVIERDPKIFDDMVNRIGGGTEIWIYLSVRPLCSIGWSDRVG